jgi:hypothetical protein
MSEQKKDRPSLASRPRVQELRRASGREKALAVGGLVMALAAALFGVLWGHRTGALSGASADAGQMYVPTLDVVGGVVVALLGATVLFFGWPLYRLTVILAGLSFGAVLAGGLGWLVAGQSGAFVGGALGGLVGGLAAWPTEVLVRTLGGSVVGLVSGLAAGSCMESVSAMILCGVGGLLLGGGLTFLFYRALIMAYSAILGALAVSYGGLSVWWPASSVRLRPALLGAAAALAVLGLFVQRTIARKDEDTQD